MSEGIEFNPIGTVDVTFDDKTYHLGRPKMRQFRHFTERLEQARIEVADELDRLRKAFEDAEDGTPARDEADRALTAFARSPFYDRTIVMLAEMFEQVGDPLPSDPDDWPAWLAADSSIPGQILTHWRTSPKVSGPTTPK